jgi:hypothetical protein
MTPRIAAASAADLAIGPTQSSEPANANTPKRLTLPQVGLMPVNPQQLLGRRMEPAVSVPSAPKHNPAAVAAPEPLEDTPDQ